MRNMKYTIKYRSFYDINFVSFRKNTIYSWFNALFSEIKKTPKQNRIRMQSFFKQNAQLMINIYISIANVPICKFFSIFKTFPLHFADNILIRHP